jgi:DNA-binding NtrC family response regulator
MRATSHIAEKSREDDATKEKKATQTLLLIDGDANSASRISEMFQNHHVACVTCSSLADATTMLQQEQPLDAALVDLTLPNGDGIEAIRIARKTRPDLPCIVLSARSDTPSVVLAMKAGAVDYLTKPCRQSTLLSTVSRAIDDQRHKTHTTHATTPRRSRWQSPAMRQAMIDAREAAKTGSPVMLVGPPGSGKKSIAQWIHRKSSRANQCFITIDASHVPQNRVEQELFGKSLTNQNGSTHAHVTPKIQACMGGTLYIENLQCLSTKAQAELLEWIKQNQSTSPEKSCRLITSVVADTQHLQPNSRVGQLRPDLWYAASVYRVNVPGLAQRSQDIPRLCENIVSHICTTHHLRVPGITRKAMELLCDYSWPGNIGELHSVLEHAITHTDDRLIGPSDLAHLNDLDIKKPSEAEDLESGAGSIEALTKTSLINALEACHGNRRRAAKRLKVSLRTIYNMINRYGLPKKQPRKKTTAYHTASGSGA